MEWNEYVEGYKKMFPEKVELLEQVSSVLYDDKLKTNTIDSLLATEIIGWVAETYYEGMS